MQSLAGLYHAEALAEGEPFAALIRTYAGAACAAAVTNEPPIHGLRDALRTVLESADIPAEVLDDVLAAGEGCSDETEAERRAQAVLDARDY